MQPQGHMQVGVNLIDYGMDPQTALDAPRFQWTRGMEFGLEDFASAYVLQELIARGHELLPLGHRMHYGGGQAIVRDSETGVLVGGSEPRNDGSAVGF